MLNRMLAESAMDENHLAAVQAGAPAPDHQAIVINEVNQAMAVLAPTLPATGVGTRYNYPAEIKEASNSLV